MNLFKSIPMKKSILMLLGLLCVSLIQAQDLKQLQNEYAGMYTNNDDLLKGVEIIDKKCTEEPSEDCDKLKALNLYLISKRFYRVAYSLISLDVDLRDQTAKKALEYYNKANAIYPAEKVKPYTQHLLFKDKQEYEEQTK